VLTTYINYISVDASSDVAWKSQTALHAKQAMPNRGEGGKPMADSVLVGAVDDGSEGVDVVRQEFFGLGG